MFEIFVFIVLFLIVVVLFSEPKDMNRNNFATEDEYLKYLVSKKKKRATSSRYKYNDDDISSGQKSTSSNSDDYYDYNPASGLPMSGGVDVSGNAFGSS